MNISLFSEISFNILKFSNQSFQEEVTNWRKKLSKIDVIEDRLLLWHESLIDYWNFIHVITNFSLTSSLIKLWIQ